METILILILLVCILGGFTIINFIEKKISKNVPSYANFVIVAVITLILAFVGLVAFGELPPSVSCKLCATFFTRPLILQLYGFLLIPSSLFFGIYVLLVRILNSFFAIFLQEETRKKIYRLNIAVAILISLPLPILAIILSWIFWYGGGFSDSNI